MAKKKKSIIPSSLVPPFLTGHPASGKYHLDLPTFHMLILTNICIHTKTTDMYICTFSLLDKNQTTFHSSASAVVFNLTMYPGHISEAAHVKLFHYL